MLHRLVSTRRRKLVALFSVLALAFAGVALASWYIGTLSGSGGGQVADAQQIGEITFAPYTGNVDPGDRLAPGGSAPAIFASVDNPTGHTVTVTAATAGAITPTPACDVSAISFDASRLVGLSFPPGTTGIFLVQNSWHATQALSETCQNAHLAVALTGTTSGQ